MAHEFRLPDIGEGLTEGEIVRWLVPVGGTVAVDETVVEVETDKAVFEIPSPYAGTVLQHGAAEGEQLKVGEILVVIGNPGEAWPPAPAVGPVATSADAAPIVGTLSEEAEDLTVADGRGVAALSVRVKAMPSVRRLARQLGVDLTTLHGTGREGRLTREDVIAKARHNAGPSWLSTPTATNGDESAERHRVLSPVVRRLADDLGVEVGTVAGSGPGGRITRNDVVNAAGSAVPASGPRRDDGDERRPMSALRRSIAANVSRSWSEIPQVTAFDEVDATRLLEVRAALRTRHGAAIPIDALVIAAVVPALVEFPEFNATVDGQDVIVHQRHDIGLAVSSPDGLLVAVIRDARGMRLLALAAEVVRLGEAARARTLGRAELTGQTFTVSNIGAVGGGHGTPIVPVGTTAILSVGRAADKPVVRGGAIVVAPVLPLSLSYDHRVIDGALGRRFLAMVTENLADPALAVA